MPGLRHRIKQICFPFKEKKERSETENSQMAPQVLVLIYGPNTFPAWDLATKCFSADVTVMHCGNEQQDDWVLQKWIADCSTAILLVCNCSNSLKVPLRTDVNAFDSGKMPSVRMFVCAQSNECLPGYNGLPPQCELLLCDSLSGALTPDSMRHLYAVFANAKQIQQVEFMPQPQHPPPTCLPVE